MTISSVIDTGRTTTNPVDNGASVEDLTNNFMTLLVAQMQNQDPTNPMDNNQLTSQLAQFNTASGVQKLNNTLNNVGTLVTSMQQMNASQWVGRTVLTEGVPVISMNDGGNKKIAFSLNNDTDKVAIMLTDSQGYSYRTELKNVKAGVHQYNLDELSDFQPDGPYSQSDNVYKVSFFASNEDGASPDIVALKENKVDSVSFTPTGAVLQLGLSGTATLGDVYLIK